MAKYRIGWMPGDGIGVEVMAATRIVLDAVELDAEYVPAEIGWEFWKHEGNALPDRTLETLRSTDAALFGAITSRPPIEADAELAPELRGRGLAYRSPIVRLRQELELHTNRRPCYAFPGNPLNLREGVDLVVFRENTEDLYAGVEFRPVPDGVRQALRAASPPMLRFDDVLPEDLAITARIVSRRGAERILRAAFTYAATRRYPDVTLVEKPNVLQATSGLMLSVAREVAREFPAVELRTENVDAMAMRLLKDPHDFGVLASSNLFGDILSDLAAQLVGGLGFAAGANLGDDYAIFEPAHGSAPRHAGKNRCNPIAMILSAQMMLEWLGEDESAARVHAAVADVVARGHVRTYDVGGASSTTEVASAVAHHVRFGPGA
jgi:3-isopropylmalate dehydrogenase